MSGDRHYGMVLEANARSGPGRGPAPEPGPDRWWWRRWRMYDALLWDAIEQLPASRYDDLMTHWPTGWPSVASGLLSVRQMEWVRVHMISGRFLDARGRLFA